MLNLISESTNAIKLEDIIKKHKIPSTHSSSSKYAVDKTITLGKVEGAIEVCVSKLNTLVFDAYYLMYLVSSLSSFVIICRLAEQLCRN